jgi:hypothetical protein
MIPPCLLHQNILLYLVERKEIDEEGFTKVGNRR